MALRETQVGFPHSRIEEGMEWSRLGTEWPPRFLHPQTPVLCSSMLRSEPWSSTVWLSCSFLMAFCPFAVSHPSWITLRGARNFCNIGTFPFFSTGCLLTREFLFGLFQHQKDSDLFQVWHLPGKIIYSSEGLVRSSTVKCTCLLAREFRSQGPCDLNKPGCSKAASHSRSVGSITLFCLFCTQRHTLDICIK